MISRWKKEFLENSAAAFEAPKVSDAAIEKERDRYLRKISISRQCQILGLSRTAHYYVTKGESAVNLHNSLDASNCISVLRNAIAQHAIPEIIYSDQGSQFTCLNWMAECAKHPEIKISMDGRGRIKDNIWIERFGKTIKYEYIYITPEENGTELFTGIKRFIEDYNFDRRHQGIGIKTPAELYRDYKIPA